MQIAAEIAKIEEGLRVAKVPLGRLLGEAGVDRSTWSRWRAGHTGPRLSNWLAIQAASNRLAGESKGAQA